MPREHPQRRRIRLVPAVYADIGEICSITVTVKGRPPVFASPAVAAAVLRRHAAATGVPVCAWCAMPDHVHLILGASTNCGIVTFLGQFKTWRSVKRGGSASRARSGRLASGTIFFAAMSGSRTPSSTS
jgi:REP element-mobilizing transposase RayT